MSLPSAAVEDLAEGGIVYLALEWEPANETIEHRFMPAVAKDGSTWVYFDDETVAEFGEVARQVSA